MLYVVVIVLVIVGFCWFSRANELFCVSIRNGRTLLVRGRAPVRLLDDFREVVAEPPVSRATIRACKDRQGARLYTSGISDPRREQRLRNVFHLYPLSNLRSAPRPKNRTIGQLLGIAWLAWLLDCSIGR